MTSKPATPLPAAALALLACPVCYGSLQQRGMEVIACMDCERMYPVSDGIPVLIASEST